MGEKIATLVSHIFDWLKRLTVWLVLLYRRARYGYAFRRIRLAQPRYAIVDPEDYERLSKYEWEARRARNSPFYVARQARHSTERKFTLIFMHREIITVGDGLFVDHINHKTFDNRKANLRPATQTQNNRNRRKFSGQSNSKYKGVYWKKHIKKWVAQIGVNKKVIHLGCFKKEKDAAKAYDEGARMYHKEFASLNFPDSPRRTRRTTKKEIINSSPHEIACPLGGEAAISRGK